MAETYSVATELGPDLPEWWEIKSTYGETVRFKACDLASITSDENADCTSFYRLHSSDRTYGLGGWSRDDAKDFLLAIHGKLNHSNKKIKPWPGPPNPQDSTGQAGEESMAKLYTDFFNRVERLSRVRSVGPYPPDWE